MVRKTVDAPETEPNSFQKPSEAVHLFQVSDVWENSDGTVTAKCEVAEGDELGRSLLHRVSLDEEWKGFFATRMFLKATGLPYKGNGILIDTDDWIGRKFRAQVVHDGKYANIDDYDWDNLENNPPPSSPLPESKDQEKAWDET